MVEIGLVRHGITEWNKLGKAQGLSDIPLCHEGVLQANKIASRLSKEKAWDAIISSPLLRAWHTAQIINEKLCFPIIHADERIKEINCGQIEGTTEEERIQRWGENWRDLNLGMEAKENVAQRGISFLEDMCIRYEGKRVLVISHGALIGLTLQHVLPNLFPTTYIENTSLTILEHKSSKWSSSLYNCTLHMT